MVLTLIQPLSCVYKRDQFYFKTIWQAGAFKNDLFYPVVIYENNELTLSTWNKLWYDTVIFGFLSPKKDYKENI